MGDYGLADHLIETPLGANCVRSRARTALLPAPSVTAAPPPIVFTKVVDSNDPELFLIRPDGTGVKRLTRTSTGDSEAEWSPDGKSLVYRCKGPVAPQGIASRGDICIKRIGRSGKIRLTSTKAADKSPTWSPGGGRIAFIRIRRLNDGESHSYRYHLMKMRSDGSGVRRLTSDDAYDDFPSWSPDGSKIAFISDRLGNQDIFTIRPNGTRIRNLSASSESETDRPSWSPNGRWLAYSRFVDSTFDPSGWQIFKMRSDGTSVRRLTGEGKGGLNLGATWSGNGRWIAFSREDDLWRMRPDGSDEHRISGTASTSTSLEIEPSWRPKR